ncbi:MAG: acetylserotonin O-methyltransferase [Actinomycetota bacterium]|nr:methyltransferase [Acidimicrobiia bacterium]MDQ3293650.1 acetylserotonin O-methyltransferase [Actinomycetota bacterium]
MSATPGSRQSPAGIYGAQVATLLNGAMVAQAISVVAELGVADLLADGPRPTTELAAATGTHEGSLFRLLRALAAVGVLQDGGDGSFSLTPMGQLLRSDVDGSMCEYAAFVGGDWQRALGALLGAVRTGSTGFEAAFGKPFYEHLATEPEAEARWNRYLDQTTQSLLLDDNVLDQVPVAAGETVVDVGGGRGQILAELLRLNPGVKGVLTDLPFAVEGADEVLRAAGVADRCDVVGGDMFHGVPPGADAYFLCRVLTNWDDERCHALLTGIREAMAPGGRVVAVEGIVPDGGGPHFTKLADLGNMVVGGRLRTRSEWDRLLGGAGLGAIEIRTTRSVVFTVIEAQAT